MEQSIIPSQDSTPFSIMFSMQHHNIENREEAGGIKEICG